MAGRGGGGGGRGTAPGTQPALPILPLSSSCALLARSPRSCHCSLASAPCHFQIALSPSTSLRNCQAKVTLAGQGLARGPDTHPRSDTPSQQSSRNLLRGWGLLQASVPGEGRESQGKGCWGWGMCSRPASVAAGGPWQLGRCVGWVCGGGALPYGAGWLWWEQIVFTPSPHTQPTLASYSRGLSHPWALCTTSTFAFLLQEIATLSRERLYRRRPGPEALLPQPTISLPLQGWT